MRGQSVIFFTLALAVLVGYHDTVLSFNLAESSPVERSEENPLRDSEEHSSAITLRAGKPLVSKPEIHERVNNSFKLTFYKVVKSSPVRFKSSLHILFLSLRH